MTTDDNNEVVVGHCFYNCENGTTSAKTRPSLSPINTPTYRIKIHNLTAAVCKDLNRDGRLCGKCEKGYHPPVYSYSYKCIKCPNRWYNWLKFIAETWPVLKPSDGFKAGQTASKRFSNVTELSPPAFKPAGRFRSLP